MPKTCPVCEQNGVESAMKIRQYSFNQAIWMCTNDKCTFPLGYKELDQFLVTYSKDIGEVKYDPKLDGEDKVNAFSCTHLTYVSIYLLSERAKAAGYYWPVIFELI